MKRPSRSSVVVSGSGGVDAVLVLQEDGLLIPLPEDVQPDHLHQHICHLSLAVENGGGRGHLAVVVALRGGHIVDDGQTLLLLKGQYSHADGDLPLRNQLKGVEGQYCLLAAGVCHLDKRVVAVDVIPPAV